MSTIPLWCRPGVEVECIRDFSQSKRVNDRGLNDMPEVGQKYVLDGAEYWPDLGMVGVRLIGFPGQQFHIVGFSPVTPRTAEQDIAEHFARHLTAPEGVNA